MSVSILYPESRRSQGEARAGHRGQEVGQAAVHRPAGYGDFRFSTYHLPSVPQCLIGLQEVNPLESELPGME